MKTKICFLIFLIGFGSILGVVQAQCVHNISTDPLNPVNNQFDSIYSGKTNVFLNTFDWGGIDGIFDEVPLNGSAGWSNVTIPGDNYYLNTTTSESNKKGESNGKSQCTPYSC